MTRVFFLHLTANYEKYETKHETNLDFFRNTITLHREREQMMKKINIRDVAKEAGTSISSVSRCLNDVPGVAAVVRRRILAAAHRLGYDVRSRKQHVVALILPTIQIPEIGLYCTAVIDSVRKKAAEKGYGCLMISQEDIALLSEAQISCAISFDYLGDVSHRFPNMKNIPLVCFNDIGNHLEQVYTVHSNEEKGIRMAVEYLLQHHHTRIGLLSVQETPGNLCTHLRCKAFWDITESLGIRNSCAVHFFSNELPAQEAVGLLLKKKCTALIAMGENSAPAVIYGLSLLGKRIPEDVSLITHETQYSRFYVPRLTTIAQDFPAMVEASFDLLEKMMRGEKDLSDREIDYKLIVRESVRDLFQTESEPLIVP